MLSFILPLNEIQRLSFPASGAYTESALVDALIAGEKKAIENLYTSYATALLAIISKIIKQDEVAEEVLHETFLKIWSSITLYDSSKGRLFTWMARLARNKAIDQLRTRGEVYSLRTDGLDDSAMQVNQLYQIELNTEFIDLKQLIKTLTPIQTTIIEMVYFQGYTQAEVAEALGIPIGTVKTKIRKGIKTMRSLF